MCRVQHAALPHSTVIRPTCVPSAVLPRNLPDSSVDAKLADSEFAKTKLANTEFAKTKWYEAKCAQAAFAETICATARFAHATLVDANIG